MSDKKEYNKQYHQGNREKILEDHKKRYQDNKEEILEDQKQYRQNNPLKQIWKNIRQRCYNPKGTSYKNYGGRGIAVCDEWLGDFETFKRWCLDNGYQKGLQIDRIDNNGNYSPLNCQFITQAKNVAIGKKRKQINNSSGFVGVCFHKGTGKYQARINVNKKYTYLGLFTTPEEACQARIDKEIELFGEQKTNLK